MGCSDGVVPGICGHAAYQSFVQYDAYRGCGINLPLGMRPRLAGTITGHGGCGQAEPGRMINRGMAHEAMVPAEGIEPPTFGLQNRCSTAELSRLQDQWVSANPSPVSGRRRQADPVLRRHLPELPAQGYWPATSS